MLISARTFLNLMRALVNLLKSLELLPFSLAITYWLISAYWLINKTAFFISTKVIYSYFESLYEFPKPLFSISSILVFYSINILPTLPCFFNEFFKDIDLLQDDDLIWLSLILANCLNVKMTESRMNSNSSPSLRLVARSIDSLAIDCYRGYMKKLIKYLRR